MYFFSPSLLQLSMLNNHEFYLNHWACRLKKVSSLMIVKLHGIDTLCSETGIPKIQPVNSVISRSSHVHLGSIFTWSLVWCSIVMFLGRPNIPGVARTSRVCSGVCAPLTTCAGTHILQLKERNSKAILIVVYFITTILKHIINNSVHFT